MMSHAVGYLKVVCVCVREREREREKGVIYVMDSNKPVWDLDQENERRQISSLGSRHMLCVYTRETLKKKKKT